MSNLDYIKSYLIKVGVDVDGNSINKYDQFIKKTDSKIGNLVKKIAGYGVKVNAFWDTILVGSYKFSTSIAKADMELQKLSRRMYMSRDSAKALQTTLNAMGLDQSDLQDIALNPELTQQYRELLRLSRSLGTPDSVKETLKDIRSISFEFSRLNVIFSHFMERVVHFAFRTLGKPARDFKKFLQDFNQRFAKNIDTWAKRIGTTLGIIVRLALRFKELLADIGGYISSLWSKLTKLQKGIILAIGAIGVALKAGPFGTLLTLISGLLMLFDDYKVYKEGGVSANVLKPVWRQVDNQLNNPDSIFNRLKDTLTEVFDPENIKRQIGELTKKINTWYEEFLKNHPVLKSLLEEVTGWTDKIVQGIKALFNPEERAKIIQDIKTKIEEISNFINLFWARLEFYWNKKIDEFQDWYHNLVQNSPILQSLYKGIMELVNWIRKKLGLPEIPLVDFSQPRSYGKGERPQDSKILSENLGNLPKNPWTPEGQAIISRRLKTIDNTNKMKLDKESWKDFGILPQNPWSSEGKSTINQIFNFKIEGIQKPEELAREFSTIVRNNKPKLVS